MLSGGFISYSESILDLFFIGPEAEVYNIMVSYYYWNTYFFMNSTLL